MRKNNETEKADKTTLVHTEERHREASGGWIEYDYSTEYHLNTTTRQVTVREYSSCDNTRDRRGNWSHKLESETTIALGELPKGVRLKVQSLLKSTC